MLTSVCFGFYVIKAVLHANKTTLLLHKKGRYCVFSTEETNISCVQKHTFMCKMLKLAVGAYFMAPKCIYVFVRENIIFACV